MTEADSYNLARFAKEQAPVFASALTELKNGHKQTHWMWFVFPQMRGLGQSDMADFYGIGSFDEARAYIADPLLGARLDQCTRAILGVKNRTLEQILVTPDDLKFCSSMSLFSLAVTDDWSVFRDALNRYCQGRIDTRTLAILKADPARAYA